MSKSKPPGAYRAPGKKLVTLELPSQTVKDLDRRVETWNLGSQRDSMTRSSLIRGILHDWLDNKPKGRETLP